MWHWFGFERQPAQADDAKQADGDAGAPARGRFLSALYRSAAGSRRYKLYVPSGYRGQPVPLLLMLHGCKQDPDDFAAGTRMNAIAEDHHCLVVYPAQSRHGNGMRCWNWFEPQHQRRDGGEPSLLVGIVRKVMAVYQVDPDAVYVAGMSAGGAMAWVLAATYPELFRAAGLHSALPYACANDAGSALDAMQSGALLGSAATHPCPVPVIVFHGDADELVHPRNADAIVRQRLAAKAASPLRRSTEQSTAEGGRRAEIIRYHDAEGRTVAELWQVQGLGHAWSGGSARGSHTDPRGPDASAQMMAFFRARSADKRQLP